MGKLNSDGQSFHFMHPRTKSSLLWAVVGFLSFLVLIQAFELVTGNPVDLWTKAVVAVVVGVAAAVVTRQSQERLVEDEQPQSVDETENESP